MKRKLIKLEGFNNHIPYLQGVFMREGVFSSYWNRETNFGSRSPLFLLLDTTPLANGLHDIKDFIILALKEISKQGGSK